MTLLVDLPEEIISATIHNLSHDKNSLQNVCLAGNHILLAIARPLTWKQVTLHVNFDNWNDQRNIWFFTADPKRAASVVSAKFLFSGLYEYDQPITSVLQKALRNMTGLNHTCLSFFESYSSGSTIEDEDGAEDAPLLLEIVLKCLPKLKTIFVEGYDSGEGLVVPVVLPQLSQLVSRYCSPSVAEIWTSARHLEVIELFGGDGDRYYHDWCHSIHMDYPKESNLRFTGYSGNIMGSGYLLNEIALKLGYFNCLRRFYIGSEEIGRQSCMDADHVVEFFKLNLNPLPGLEELVIRCPLTVEEYEAVIASAANASLRRLSMDIDSDLPDEALGPVFAKSSIWEKFTSLEELSLPIKGLDEEQMDILLPAISSLGSLTHLYFLIDEGDWGAYPRTHRNAMRLGHGTPQLEMVVWDQFPLFHDTLLPAYGCKLLRDNNGTVTLCNEGAIKRPGWQYLSSPFEWWGTEK
ncbi:hypothetical protein GYMLUDRAFT_412004 [Collybiopsis luxurians FD-317 M1]|nr:hypothetical protein GYMLUDRAFT_412004 [Collybiopsis luxurians FD-317 M1]